MGVLIREPGITPLTCPALKGLEKCMFVLRKKQILLLACSARSPRGSLVGTLILASCICPDARCPDVEDQRELAGTRVPTGEGLFSTTGLLHAFVYEERHSIVPHSFPRGAGPAVPASFGRTSASISISDLIKTDLSARPDPRLSVCVSRIPWRNNHCCYQLGLSPSQPCPPNPGGCQLARESGLQETSRGDSSRFSREPRPH